METGVPHRLATRDRYYNEATDASMANVWSKTVNYSPLHECLNLHHMKTGVPHRLATKNVCLGSLESLDMRRYYADATDASIANVWLKTVVYLPLQKCSNLRHMETGVHQHRNLVLHLILAH